MIAHILHHLHVLIMVYYVSIQDTYTPKMCLDSDTYSFVFYIICC